MNLVSNQKLERSHVPTKGSSQQEDPIILQFHKIQKGYNLLMSEISKELDLVKRWFEKESRTRRNEIKHKFTSKISEISKERENHQNS
jgi:Mlc titration factor MtfA (ptsG expression regulator)